ncbi:MAG: hypothetical protein WAM92_15515 [Mycobacterium sp.]
MVLDAADDATSVDDAAAAAQHAQARAEAARARADELRLRVDNATRADRRAKRRSRWRTILKGAVIGGAVLLIATSLTLTGLMMWQHRDANHQRQREAEFTAAARQSVVTMMSLDPATVRQEMQRVVDNSTGKFKQSLEAGGAEEIAKGVERSGVRTTLTVQAAAVDSMTDDSAVVLVAATSEGTTGDGQKLPSAPWRISVSLKDENGQLKTSQFEFVS